MATWGPVGWSQFSSPIAHHPLPLPTVQNVTTVWTERCTQSLFPKRAREKLDAEAPLSCMQLGLAVMGSMILWRQWWSVSSKRWESQPGRLPVGLPGTACPHENMSGQASRVVAPVWQRRWWETREGGNVAFCVLVPSQETRTSRRSGSESSHSQGRGIGEGRDSVRNRRAKRGEEPLPFGRCEMR